MAGQSDGVIVGSAIVKLCGQYGVECVPYVKEYVKSMKDAVRELSFFFYAEQNGAPVRKLQTTAGNANLN